MKILTNLLLAFTLFTWSCSPPPEKAEESPSTRFPERAKDMVIYEVNVRQYTAEGTFNAFAEHLPRLKSMGIDILWLMPIQAIGEEKRKGSLGSYYSIKDYKVINPEYGSNEDFKALVDRAHALDMMLIIDWVPNHTAWDHPWITSNPAYYVKDENGEIRMAQDWSDVAQLNYDNEELRKEMVADMRYWIETFDIDGFRQDHAGNKIPLDFWQDATEELNQIKDLFWLAEWDTPQMHFAFHATYAWAFHHLSGEVARGEKNVNDITEYLKNDRHRYGKYAYRMNFTSNHDENSWQGTVFERYGDGYQTAAVLMATIDGIPLLYGGQEAALNKRLRFFEKDTIDWSEIPLESFYTKLFKLRKENQALWSGDYGGKSVRINENNDEKVYAFVRSKEGNNVVVLLNLSGEVQSFNLKPGYLSGTQTEVFSGESIAVEEGNEWTLDPWEYQVFTFESKRL